MNFVQNEDGMVFVVGVPGGPKDDEVPALQDRAWKVYCEAFQDGGLPVVGLGIGTARKGGNPVLKWTRNVVAIDEIAARTGIPAPATSTLFEDLDEDELKVDVPHRELRSAQEAFDFGYQCATLWIDAWAHRGY